MTENDFFKSQGHENDILFSGPISRVSGPGSLTCSTFSRSLISFSGLDKSFGRGIR